MFQKSLWVFKFSGLETIRVLWKTSKVPALRPNILSVAMCQSLKVMFFLEGHLQNPKETLANIEKK